MNIKIALLPQPPVWKSRVVEVQGGTTKKQIKFFHRDGMDAYKFIYGNPLFAGHQDNVPMKIWFDYENDIRILAGPMTCDLVHDIQVCA